jgi:acyl-CoA synthetase (AMP-forming)/AMP-acid ligase II
MKPQPHIRLVADMTRYHCVVRPERPAVVCGERVTSYADLDRQASKVANAMLTEGLKPQSRVAVLDKNSGLFFEILFGAAKSNNAVVAVNWRLSPAEISYIINDAEVEILFVGSDFFATVEAIRADLNTVRSIIAIDGPHAEWKSYPEWRDAHNAADPMLEASGSDVVLQMYTSGTTGHPKGAQLTNENLLTLMPSAVREWGNWTEEDVSMVSMPLFHIGGTGYAMLGFYAGAANVVVRETDCIEILRLISERRVTKTFWVPALILFLLQTTGVEECDLTSLDLIIYGASPMPADLLRNAMRAFKCKFAQVYGLTETTGAITWLSPEEHEGNDSDRLRSCGVPMKQVEIRVVDADGNELPFGEVGEIICRSTQNMKGYWNLPDATASTLRGGWLYTGDAGYVDADGYLYIHDRIKDMIISGGENIYPAEVESCLFGNPKVADVAVIGVPDEKWGEAVKAFVVRKPGVELTEPELIAFARERIAHYKAPRTIEFVNSLPRNPSGKILKRELRARYWTGRDRQVN